MNNYLVMSEKEAKILRRRARVGWVALGVGVLLFCAASFQLGRYAGHRDTADQLAWLTYQQQESTRMLEKAWADQRNGINLVQAAAERIRERDEIVLYNQENMCPDFQKAMAKRAK